METRRLPKWFSSSRPRPGRGRLDGCPYKRRRNSFPITRTATVPGRSFRCSFKNRFFAGTHRRRRHHRRRRRPRQMPGRSTRLAREPTPVRGSGCLPIRSATEARAIHSSFRRLCASPSRFKIRTTANTPKAIRRHKSSAWRSLIIRPHRRHVPNAARVSRLPTGRSWHSIQRTMIPRRHRHPSRQRTDVQWHHPRHRRRSSSSHR